MSRLTGQAASLTRVDRADKIGPVKLRRCAIGGHQCARTGARCGACQQVRLPGTRGVTPVHGICVSACSWPSTMSVVFPSAPPVPTNMVMHCECYRQHALASGVARCMCFLSLRVGTCQTIWRHRSVRLHLHWAVQAICHSRLAAARSRSYNPPHPTPSHPLATALAYQHIIWSACHRWALAPGWLGQAAPPLHAPALLWGAEWPPAASTAPQPRAAGFGAMRRAAAPLALPTGSARCCGCIARFELVR